MFRRVGCGRDDSRRPQRRPGGRRPGSAVRLYRVIAAQEDGYVIIQGLVGADRETEMIPEFRRLTESFRRAAGGQGKR